MHNAISARDSAYDSIVKFSPSVCMAVVAFFTWEMAAQSFAYGLMEQQTVTNPAVIMVWVPWQNIKSAMHARSGSPPDDKSSY